MAFAQDMVRQTVDGEDAEPGQRGGQPFQQRHAGGIARPARAHDQRDPLGIRAAFDQPGEALAKDGGLARARPTREQQGAVLVVEDTPLVNVGGEGGGNHIRDATPHHRQGPSEGYRSGRGGTQLGSAGVAGRPSITWRYQRSTSWALIAPTSRPSCSTIP